MSKRNTEAGIYFRTIHGRPVLVNLVKSSGSLALCLTSKSSFSYLWGVALSAGALTLGPSYVAVFPLLYLVVLVLYKLLFSVRQEKLLIVKGLGYQISKQFLLRDTRRFIPYERVQQVFINEVILRHKVIYILTLLVQRGARGQQLIPLFTDTLPKLDCLEVIYRHIKCFNTS